jgi:large subunit ribosomal protein L4
VSGKTRDAVAFLEKLGLAGQKVMFIVPNEATEERSKFALSFRNIPRVTVVPVAGVNVYDLINSKKVVCVSAALNELDARVSKAAE